MPSLEFGAQGLYKSTSTLEYSGFNLTPKDTFLKALSLYLFSWLNELNTKWFEIDIISSISSSLKAGLYVWTSPPNSSFAKSASWRPEAQQPLRYFLHKSKVEYIAKPFKAKRILTPVSSWTLFKSFKFFSKSSSSQT